MIDPVSTVTVSDISDQMPMCHEDIPTLSLDDLIIPFCDTAKSDNPTKMYCISSKHNGDCLECPLSSGGVDCQGHTFYLYLHDEEPDPILEPVEDDEDFDLMSLLEEPDRPSYCSQNGGDCSTCSLVNYGRDCMNNPVRDREVKS